MIKYVSYKVLSKPNSSTSNKLNSHTKEKSSIYKDKLMTTFTLQSNKMEVSVPGDKYIDWIIKISQYSKNYQFIIFIHSIKLKICFFSLN